ncbi:FAD-dependent oxidoreductase, partial [Bacillus sp. RHFS18]|nr:FAD-dependent oxidoreductase [Bacillus sp. RHFS18]
MALNKPKIVVLGAGYGGLMTVTRLPKHIGANDADITLVNKHNYHYETTWMHEASAGTLHHDRCRYQIKDVINESRVKFVQDTVKAIDVQNKKVTLSQGDIPYDYLVIGLGAVPETFGIKGLKEFAFPIANINTSRQLKDHIELQFATYNT